MKQGCVYLIIVVLIITHGTFYFMGINYESAQNEKEIELTYEAAAQSYKNSMPNDTSKFDYYGNKRAKEDTLRRVLPQNSRTKIAKPTANRDKEQNDQARKRN